MRQLIIFAVMVVFAACGGAAKRTVAGAAEGQVIELSDSIIEHRVADTINFGLVRRGEMVERALTVRNVSDKALIITQLDLSCGCVQAEYPHDPLMPLEEGEMTLTLDTRDLSAWVFKTVGVRTTQGNYTLCITAEVQE